MTNRNRLLAASTVLTLAFAAPAAAEDLPYGAEPTPAWELVVLFGGKTWEWPSGGGYFDPDRSFVGWTEADGVSSTAEGRWTVTDSGRLCFHATWLTGDAAVQDRTCFLHAQSEGDIYQRSADSGEWYIFKHAVVQEDDEFNKLVPGNQKTIAE